MKIFVMGADGYLGFPLCYELSKTEHTVIGVDNDSRNKWVFNCGGLQDYSSSILDKCKNIHIIKGDLTDRSLVNELLKIHKPDCIIHLASQPSMPYSDLNGERALFTQINNISMCVNLLWGIKENGLKSKVIITTTTGIVGQCLSSIPEAGTINGAGSWYHVSRGFDSSNCSLASRQWGQDVLELRTSIVYGLQTDLMKKHGVTSRFDTDFYFGTALNRFIKQAIRGEEITIYGKGEQMKPFISLEDCVHSLINAIDYPVSGHEIMNQVTNNVSIKELAEMIFVATGAKITHIDNPRKEKEDFKMKFQNDKFLKLLGREPKNMAEEVSNMIHCLRPKAPITLTFDYCA